MLLPIIVIVLVSIGIYLAYQKNMSNENKIIIAVIAVLCFNLAYIYLKKTTITQNETFVDMDNSISTDDGTYDIPRPMLYLDPDGTLNVENINVGKISGLSQTTEPSNINVDTVSLTGSKYKLYVKKDGEEEVLMWGNKEIARQ